MNQDTGEIKELKDIPEKERKGYVEVNPDMVKALAALSVKERLEQLQHERVTQKPYFFTKSTIKPPLSAKKKKAKRKVKKLSRRRNRKV